jgi:hypothetical protein
MCWNLIYLITHSIPTHKSNHLLMHAKLINNYWSSNVKVLLNERMQKGCHNLHN